MESGTLDPDPSARGDDTTEAPAWRLQQSANLFVTTHIIATALATLFDLLTGRPEYLWTATWKVLVIGIFSAERLALLRRDDDETARRAIYVTIAAALIAGIAGDVRSHDSVSVPIMCVAYAVMSSLFFSWPRESQIVVAVMVMVSAIAHLVAIDDWQPQVLFLIASFAAGSVIFSSAVTRRREQLRRLLRRDAERRIELERAQLALTGSEEHLRTLLEAARDITTVVSLDGQIRYVSPAVTTVLGHRPESLTGAHLDLIVHPLDLPRVRQTLVEPLPDGPNPLDAPLRVRNASGAWSHFEVVRGSYSEVLKGIVFTARDVTRLQAETRMRAAVTDALRFASTHGTEESIFEHSLAQLVELSGSEYGFLGELLAYGDQPRHLKTHAISAAAWNDATRSMAAGMTPNLEFRNFDNLFGAVAKTGLPVIANDPEHDARRGQLPAGHPPLRSFLGLPIIDGDEMIGIVGLANREGGYDQQMVDYLQPLLVASATNLARLRHQRAARGIANQLSEADAWLRQAIELSGAILWRWTRDEPAIRLAGSWGSLLGYTAPANGLDQHTFFDLVHPDDVAPLTAALSAHLAKPTQPVEIEYRMRHQDGTYRSILNRVVARCDEHGERIASYGAAIDFTARRHLELKSAAFTAHVTAADATRSALLAAVSDQVRSATRGMLDAADGLAPGGTGESQRSGVEQIRAAGERLLLLIDNVFDFSTIVDGRVALDTKLVDPTALVARVVSIFAKEAADKGIHLEYNATDDVPAQITIDPRRLHQVIANLIASALTFTETGGITVQLAAQCTVEPDYDFHLTVRDTGRGFDNEELANLFAPNAPRAGDRRDIASLGLEVSKELADALGGSLWVESQRGTGSTYHFTFAGVRPAPEPAVPVAPLPKEAVATTFSDLAVLVVEDNSVNQFFLVELLATLGIHATVANDGGEGVEATRAQRFDVIFMDIVMPNMDGLQATQLIRAEHGHTSHRPWIVAMTAGATDDDRKHCKSVGMDDFVPKPIVRGALEETITKALRERERRQRINDSVA